MNLAMCSLVSILLLLGAAASHGGEPSARGKVVLVIHGGAGVVDRAKMTPESEGQYREALRRALRAGYEAMRKEGGTSLDGVEQAIRVLEDSPLFNAGKGAVFTHEGTIELDASIMEGKERKAGAVAGVRRIRNPISGARAVMEKSPHVLMVGEGAERFAIGAGVAEANPVEFWTERRWKQLLEDLKEEEKEGRERRAGGRSAKGRYLGTVGAVALDRQGNLAAGTSTGGMSNKRYGRVGDSPIIGAGTYAENGTCAVSGTGHGEVFIRFAVAHDIVATLRAMKGADRSVREAARGVLAKLPKEEGGVGGVIALDADGNAAMEFDTEGMYRGTITEDGTIDVHIYKAE